MSGRLIDASHCVTGDLSSENVVKIVGTVDVEVTGTPTISSLTKAVADAFGIDRQYVFVTFNTVAGSGGRLLSVPRSAPLRFLASKINVEYEVVVPSNTTQSEFVVAAMALSDPQSDVGQAFMQSMSVSGVVVIRVAHVQDPIAVPSVIVRDQTGTIVKPAQMATSLSPNKESGVNIGAVVGGVVAGVIVLVILGVLVHYFFLTQRNAESVNELPSPALTSCEPSPSLLVSQPQRKAETANEHFSV